MPPDSQSQLDQVVNLTFFLHDRLYPAAEAMKSVESLPQITADYFSVALLESFLWLHLGVEIGYFPMTYSRRIMYEHFALMLKAYERVLKTKNVETWFTRDLQAMLDNEFTGRFELFGFGVEGKRPAFSPKLASAFQTALILANGFAQSAQARQLVKALAFTTDEVWHEAIRDPRPIAALAEAELEIESSAPSVHWAYTGFFVGWDYMQAFHQMRFTHDLPAFEIFVRGQDLVRLVREIQQWRLNFGYPQPRERFLQVARKFAGTFIKDVPSDVYRDLEKPEEEFQKELYELMTDWGAPVARTATA